MRSDGHIASRFIPIWTLALWTDSRFNGCFTGYPFVFASLTLVFEDRNFGFCHDHTIFAN